MPIYETCEVRIMRSSNYNHFECRLTAQADGRNGLSPSEIEAAFAECQQYVDRALTTHEETVERFELFNSTIGYDPENLKKFTDLLDLRTSAAKIMRKTSPTTEEDAAILETLKTDMLGLLLSPSIGDTLPFPEGYDPFGDY